MNRYTYRGRAFVQRYLIQGLSGMASGLFCTLIIGLIIQQIGALLSDYTIGQMLIVLGKVASSLTGVGIAIGTAHGLGAKKFVLYASMVNGLVGAHIVAFIEGQILIEGSVILSGSGDPISAFIATVVGVEIGNRVAGKTKLDVLITPITTILTGCSVIFCVGPSIINGVQMLGLLIEQATQLQPILMGMIIAVVMGIFLTLPISSAAIGIILGLSGIAAGAATAGCAAQMVGFAVMGFKENGVNGLIAQGLGTSMLQIPNIIKNPRIWIPPILTSVITGPLATVVFKIENVPAGAGMGTSGLVGPLLAWETMAPIASISERTIGIGLICFVLPALLTQYFYTLLIRRGWIKEGDLKLDFE